MGNETTSSFEVIRNWEHIPRFAADADEARYWMTHTLDATLMQRCLVNADNNESTTITLRIDPRMLSKIKRIARLRYLNYQSMIKQWLSERLENEMKNR